MDLPPALRAAVAAAVEGRAASAVAATADRLSRRYRAETRDGTPHVATEEDALAYSAARLPATYAALHFCLQEAAARLPDFAPASLLDAGAGPGTALWAAASVWPSVGKATLLEGSQPFRAIGARFAAPAAEPVLRGARWVASDLAAPLPDLPPHEVVTLGYVLSELAPAARGPLVDSLWALCAGVMVVVEPGTPAGYRRIHDARDRLIAAGAAIVAPCPHDRACPLAGGADWCHFGRRVARSRLHRLAKGGEAPYEDEKFAYVAAARRPGLPIAGRALRHPKGGGGRVELRLCTMEGVVDRTITRADGDLLRIARRLGWGDALP